MGTTASQVVARRARFSSRRGGRMGLFRRLLAWWSGEPAPDAPASPPPTLTEAVFGRWFDAPWRRIYAGTLRTRRRGKPLVKSDAGRLGCFGLPVWHTDDELARAG